MSEEKPKFIPLNPIPNQEVPDNYMVKQIVVLTSGNINGLQESLIQVELKKILGKTYIRSYISG